MTFFQIPFEKTVDQVDQTGRLLWSGFMLVDNVPSTPLLLSELATLKLPQDHLGGLPVELLVGFGLVGWWHGCGEEKNLRISGMVQKGLKKTNEITYIYIYDGWCI